MADDQSMAGGASAPQVDDQTSQTPEPGVPRRTSLGWSQLWQVPTIIVSLVLIAAGLRLAMTKAPENDFEGALDQVDELISDGRLAEARVQLRDVIEPYLPEAQAVEQGRFHATVADWLYADQAAQGIRSPQRCREIVDLYARARQQGLMPEPLRLERWAEVAVVVGDIDGARRRLAELEALSMADDAPASIRQRRNRILRRLVEYALTREELPYEQTMGLLEEYRDDDLLDSSDQAWASARQAELRMADGRFTEAIDHLLLEMRRIEAPAEGPGPDYGELQVLLARAYLLKGDPTRADFQLRRVIDTIPAGGVVHGQALLIMAELAMAEDDAHRAMELYDQVVGEYGGATSLPVALLGRAEIHALLGEHDASLEDYRHVARILPTTPPTPLGVTLREVTRSLVDRVDAAFVSGRLEQALPYAELAEGLYPRGEVPAEILRRLAATHRQIADDLVAAASPEGPAEVTPTLVDIPPAVRYEAGEHFRAAAAYSVSHLRTLVGVPGADSEWASSLWRAAESYDLAGEIDQAIRHYAEYVAGRSAEDPLRAMAMERLGAAHRATGDDEAAVDVYRRLREEYDKSVPASRSAVPLARSLVELERVPEAEALLLEVLSAGNRVLEPAAVDYRAAVIELGTIHHGREHYPRAIERLTEALERYPDADGERDVLFLLADSYRGEALATGERLEGEAGLNPARRGELMELRRDYFERAQRLYHRTHEGLAVIDPRRVDYGLREMVRIAQLYEAECVFDLGRYHEAVPLYEQIVRRYGNHQSSLTALVQIVNCYWELGEEDRARAAHERAMVRLRELPEAAFATPDALLDRKAWERWIANSPPGVVMAEPNN